jgi:hypothetical protein
MSSNGVEFSFDRDDSDDDIVKSAEKPKKVNLPSVQKPAEKATKKRKNAQENTEKPKRVKKEKPEKKAKDDAEKYEKYYTSGDYRNYPLYASTVCGTSIKKVIEIITPLTPDAVLRFSKDGLSIFGMEQVRMAILSTHFEASMFHPYRCEQTFEIGIDTANFAKMLQHVAKYDSLTFFIADKNKPHDLGIFQISFKKDIFSYLTVTGNETSEMEDLDIPDQKYDGFLEFSAPDFQHHIHELCQTANVVTFATNFKNFRMITKGAPNAGHFTPRHLVFNPSDEGIKFNHEIIADLKKKLDLESNEGDEEKSFTVSFSDNDDENSDGEEPSLNVVTDIVPVGNSDDEDSHDEAAEEEPNPQKRREISSMLKEINQKLGKDYIQSSYLLKYINSFTKATQLAKNVIIMFSDNGPLIIHYKIEKGVITFCLSDISAQAEQARG